MSKYLQGYLETKNMHFCYKISGEEKSAFYSRARLLHSINTPCLWTGQWHNIMHNLNNFQKR